MAYGQLAQQYTGIRAELEVLQSARGFYIGTRCEDGSPCSRESLEYFASDELAEKALEGNTWTQRDHP